MKIGLDLDGVFADFGKAFLEEAAIIWPERAPYFRKLVDVNVLSAPDRDRVFKVIEQSDNWWLGLKAYDSIRHLGRFLARETEHDIYFITSRFPTLGMSPAKQSEVWLRLCGIHSQMYMGVIVTPGADYKPIVMEGAGVEVLLDDDGDTIQQLGPKGYLLSQPWNTEYEVEHRVETVEQFFAEIMK